MLSRLPYLLLLCATGLLCACGGERPPEKKKRKPPGINRNKLAYAQVVHFGRGGKSERYKGGGWGETEEGFTWTNSHSVGLAFRLPASEHPLKLRMKLAGFTNPPWLASQHVEVLANEEKVADWQVGEISDFVAIIPPQVASHEELLVQLRIPDATSPKSLGLGEDPRMLGVSCFELEITPTDEGAARSAQEELKATAEALHGNDYVFGTVVRFGAGRVGERYKVFGWYPAERQVSWTGSEPAVLEFTTAHTERDLHLRMKLGGMIGEDLPFQPTEIRVNGRRLAAWEVAWPAEFEATIPAKVAAAREKLRIELRALEPASPAELGRGDNTRLLGVRCEALIIAQKNTAASSPAPARAERRSL